MNMWNLPAGVICVHGFDMLDKLRCVFGSEGARGTPQGPFFRNMLLCAMNLESFLAPRLVATLAADALIFVPNRLAVRRGQRFSVDFIYMKIETPTDLKT